MPSTPSNCISWFQWFVKRSDARQSCAGVATLRQSSLTQTDGRFTSHPLGFGKNYHFFVAATGNTLVLLLRCVSNWQPFQKLKLINATGRSTSTPSNCISWFQWFVKRSDARQSCAGVATLRQSSLTQTDGRFTSHPLGFGKNYHFFVAATGNTPVLLLRCVSNWQPFQKLKLINATGRSTR